MSKLRELAEIEGTSIDQLLEEGTFDSVCAGICTNKGCSYTNTVEPDCTEGWCEECEEGSVKSALILAGII